MNGNEKGSDSLIEQRRDDALRRALNTPPKQNKDLKKGKKKPAKSKASSKRND